MNQSSPAAMATPGPDGDSPPQSFGRTVAVVVALLAFFLASFPARNSDLWLHLATGRGLVQRLPDAPAAGQTWLYDVLAYGLYAVGGGFGLVLAKALLVAGLALVLLRLSRTGSEWWLAVACTVLALLAMSTRLLLQPATVSCLFLALAFWFIRERDDAGMDQPPPWLPAWPLLALFVLWVNVDPWFVFGLGAMALVWLGRALDRAAHAGLKSSVSEALHHAVALAILAAVCLLNPAHVRTFLPPPDWGWFGVPASAAGRPVTSPFLPAYFTGLGLTPAGLAYFPLLGLGLLSFIVNLPSWHWQRFLPWLALASLSAFQVRAVPFFAVFGGPVLAWNLHEVFERRSADLKETESVLWGRRLLALDGLAVLVSLVFVAAAWPGFLQAPPYEPRRWAVETPPALERGAEAVRDWHKEGKLSADAHGLHLSAETAAAFAWFCPEEKGVRDAELTAAVLDEPGAADVQLRAAGVNHLIVYDADRGRLFAALSRLLAEPQRWSLLYLEGDLAVFGWHDPSRPGADDPFRRWTLDLNRRAFHPTEADKAPRPTGESSAEVRAWWDAFWKPAATRPIDRDAATLHLFHAEAQRRVAPFQRHVRWVGSLSAALIGAPAAWMGPSGRYDLPLRLAWLQPAGATALSGLSRPALAFQQHFALQDDDTPPGLLLLAVRAARRVLAVNPDDARAHLVLGESYLQLLHHTRERVWGTYLGALIQLRQAQAAAALRRALELKPDYAQAHLRLAELFREMNYLDLALEHFRAYQKLVHKSGPPPEVSAAHFREQEVRFEKELSALAKTVEDQEKAFAAEAPGARVIDRAALALGRGLGGKARDLLLASDVAAFGTQGAALELQLLLGTGRARDAIDWTAPEHEAVLGSASYYWLRAQALAALGDYVAAEEECARLAASARGEDVAGNRKMLAAVVSQALLSGHPVGGSLPRLLWDAVNRAEAYQRVGELISRLRRDADATVLRGILALEEGAVDEAEVAFRLALSLWADEAALASGGGIDFHGRRAAQGYLRWLE